MNTQTNNETTTTDTTIAQKLLDKANKKATQAKAEKLANSGRDYAAVRRIMKKYGRGQVEAAVRGTAKEIGNRTVMGSEAKIKILVSENPHRKGTKNWKRFNKYRDGMTVAEAVKAGIERANIRYLASLGHLKVGSSAN